VDSLSSAGSADEKIGQVIMSASVFSEKPMFGHGIENGKYTNDISYALHSEPVSYHFYLSTLFVEGGSLVVILYGLLLFYLFNITSKKDWIILFFFLVCFSISTNVYERYVFLYPFILVLLNEIRLKNWLLTVQSGSGNDNAIIGDDDLSSVSFK
jgi:hypothetical protein